MLVNHFYKRSKLREELPEEVLIEVMNSIIIKGDKIVNAWPYFVRVLSEESRKHFASQQQALNTNKRGGFAESISQIMKEV